MMLMNSFFSTQAKHIFNNINYVKFCLYNYDVCLLIIIAIKSVRRLKINEKGIKNLII